MPLAGAAREVLPENAPRPGADGGQTHEDQRGSAEPAHTAPSGTAAAARPFGTRSIPATPDPVPPWIGPAARPHVHAAGPRWTQHRATASDDGHGDALRPHHP